MPTIPGYSKVSVARTGEAQDWGTDAVASAAGIRVTKGLAGARSNLARLSALGDDLSSPRVVAAREALSDAVNRSATIAKHLALVEMLMALGGAREAGSLEGALDQLEAMEDELSTSVSALLETCGVPTSTT